MLPILADSGLRRNRTTTPATSAAAPMRACARSLRRPSENAATRIGRKSPHSVTVSGVANIGPAIATATITAVASGATRRSASADVATSVEATTAGIGPYRVELSRL
ncbi:hypothetical protein A6A27_30490 [Micromonospora sp. CB01531]|nr:hypothetical protein A6A27_30490 [Micromonospora sp. CB01531]